MPNSEAIETKKLEIGSAIIIAALTGIMTLAGVMSTSFIGWFSTKQSTQLAERSAKLSEQKSCIDRFDLQENNLRSKADLFLSAFGNFIALYGHTVPPLEVREARLDEILKAGFAFSAYAPTDVANTTQQMVIRLKNTLTQKEEKKAVEYGEAANDTYKKWNLEYQDALKKINSARVQCSS